MQTDNMLNVFTLFTDINLKQEEGPSVSWGHDSCCRIR